MVKSAEITPLPDHTVDVLSEDEDELFDEAIWKLLSSRFVYWPPSGSELFSESATFIQSISSYSMAIFAFCASSSEFNVSSTSLNCAFSFCREMVFC